MILVNDDYIKIRQAVKQGYIPLYVDSKAIADLSYPSSKTRRGRIQDDGSICPTLTATGTCGLIVFERKV